MISTGNSTQNGGLLVLNSFWPFLFKSSVKLTRRNHVLCEFSNYNQFQRVDKLCWTIEFNSIWWLFSYWEMMRTHAMQVLDRWGLNRRPTRSNLICKMKVFINGDIWTASLATALTFWRVNYNWVYAWQYVVKG